MKGYLKGNYMLLIFACLAAVACGCLSPVYAIFMADIIDVLSKFQVFRSMDMSRDSEQWTDLRKDSMMIGLGFLIMAFVALIANTLQIGLFNRLAQNITSSIRKDLYKHFVTRDLEFFDNPNNSPGELCGVLSKDCLAVNTIVSTSYGAIINGLSSYVCGTILAMLVLGD